MNDQNPDADEPGFDDPASAWVRELLAESRVTEPVPADVAARLDATLASLQAERASDPAATAAPAPAVVVPLRRRIGPLLAAAAAVVVVVTGGVGIAQLARDGSGGSDSAVSADAGASAGARTVPPGADQLGSALPDLKERSTGLPGLTTTTFAQDAARVMVTLTDPDAVTAGGAVPDATGSPEGGSTDAPEAYEAPLAEAPPVTASPGRASTPDTADSVACAGPEAADAVIVPATLDGAPVALVFRPPTAAAQRVEAWSCDGATLLASASVPH